MAAIEQETSNLDYGELKEIDAKEIQADQTAVETEVSQSRKRVILEKLILCVALFFPLFLATLDTSNSPLWAFLIFSNCCNSPSSYGCSLDILLTCVDIASSFNQLSDQSWIANAYILTNTAFLPVYGQIADIFGRHLVMQSAIFIFLVGSALCTGAQTWGMIMAGRAIAGVGGTFFIQKCPDSQLRDVSL